MSLTPFVDPFFGSSQLSPFGLAGDLQRSVQDTLKNVERSLGFPSSSGGELWPAALAGSRGMALRGMRLDVREEGNNFVVETEIPGVNKEDIKVKLLKDNWLNVSAEKKKSVSEKGNQGYWREERYFGFMERTIQVIMMLLHNW